MNTSEILTLAKKLSKGLLTGRPDPMVFSSVEILDGVPGVSVNILNVIFDEATKKKQNQNVLNALLFMLSHTLELLRYQIDRQSPDAIIEADEIRNHVIKLAKNGLESQMVMIIGSVFASTKLDPGEALRAVVASSMENSRELATISQDGIPDFNEMIKDLVSEIGNNPFELMQNLSEFGNSFPDEYRAMMGSVMVSASSEVVRDAGVGWLFDASPLVQTAVASALIAQAQIGQITGNTLRRLILSRSWFPDQVRPAIDSTIKEARKRGTDTEPFKPAEPIDFRATGFDGSGCQSLFVICKTGRKYALASLLVKHGFGIRDVWVQKDMTRRDVDGMIGQVEYQMDVNQTNPDYIGTAVEHFIGVSVKHGHPLPFALLDFLETTGLSASKPNYITARDLIENLCSSKLDETQFQSAMKSAVVSSRLWPDEYPIFESWFEDDVDMERILGKGRLTQKKAMEKIFVNIIEPHRELWAERLVWVALSMRSSDPACDWIYFALVARALILGLAVKDIPIMEFIASQSATAYLQQR